MNIQETFFIFSAEKSNLSPKENEYLTSELKSKLETLKIPHKDVLGVFNGVEETSFVVVGAEHEGIVSKLSNIYAQDSFLKSYPNRETYLIFSDKTKEYLGTFKPLEGFLAKKYNNYTYCPYLNTYYVTQK